jgi:DNA-binding response OmpR family regulator
MKEIKVLLVDDEEEFSSALAERLNMRGISTATSSGGEEALHMIETDPPQVVLLDLMMPGLGGKEIFDRIRLKHPDISVIFLTGLGAPDTGPACGDCLIKPVNIDDLIRKIRSVSVRD